jgi:PAS domain S-box-containing protein
MEQAARNTVGLPSWHSSGEEGENRPGGADLSSTERKVRFGFFFALICLAVVGVVSYLSVVRLAEDAAWVEHTHEVLGSLEMLLAAATDSETAERGYVITADESYLDPYRQATAVVEGEMRHLRELTADNRSQQQRLDAVAALVTDRLANLRAVVELRKTAGFAAAQREILTGKGKQFHDRIRQLIAQMQDNERTLLKNREQLTARSSRIARAVIIGGGLLGGGIVALALLVVRRDFAGRVRAERALRQANDRLELRVRQRTAQLEKAGETDARLAAIIASSDDAIASKDLQGIITSWNPGAERLFGYSAQEAVGKPMAMLIPAERSGESLAILAGIARGETTDHFETVRITKDGSKIDVSVTISPIRDGEGRIIGASKIARDITERKRAEETLQKSELRYRTLFETLIEGFCTVEMIFDAAGKPVDYRFLEINPAFASQTGLHDAQGKLMRDLAPQHEAHWFEIYGKVALTGEPVHFENEAKALGRCFDVRAYRVGAAESRTVGILFNDITDRKLGEAKVQAQLARLNLLQQITRAIGERQDIQSIFQVVIRALEEHLPVDFCCICLYEPAENCVIVTSVGAHSEAVAMELAMTAPARIEIDQNGLSQCVRGQLVYEPDISRVQFPLPQRLARGALRSMVAAPLLVESKVFGVLIAARQQAHSFSSGECEFLRQASEHVALAAHQAQLYSALQQAYEDLRQTQKAVMQQERLLALGQMASGIAHDINNAISPVAIYTDSLLARERNLSPSGRSQLETIQRAIDDVAHTVARMREFYRQREPQLALLPVDINAMARQVMELTRARWSDMAQQRGIAIEMRTELTADLPAIMGAESEIREALTNLIFNAVDAMPDGGALTLRTGLAQDRGVAQIEVIDAGVGMDENTRRRCLEPFFSTKGERGTGLGLAMVYGTVQRHSAEIEIESAVGKGTTVRLSFAIPATPAVGAAMTSAVSAVPALRILIVDDDPLVLKSLRDALESDGHVVTTADGGQAGIDAFLAATAQGNAFPVVITDLGMPYVDGRKVSNAIKTAIPATIVLLLTGWGQRLLADGDIPPYVDRVLSKPPKLRELREALARCWEARAA